MNITKAPLVQFGHNHDEKSPAGAKKACCGGHDHNHGKDLVQLGAPKKADAAPSCGPVGHTHEHKGDCCGPKAEKKSSGFFAPIVNAFNWLCETVKGFFSQISQLIFGKGEPKPEAPKA